MMLTQSELIPQMQCPLYQPMAGDNRLFFNPAVQFKYKNTNLRVKIMISIYLLCDQ